MALRRRRPSPLRIDGREYLTTAQTADYLGIRVETLYAYVSRGVVRRRTIEGRRGSFFALAEVEELARRGRAPRAATGPERIHTQITLLDAGDVLRYRGRDVAELATAMTFEQVCALLWDRDVAVRFAARPGVLDAARCAVEVMPAGARPQDLLKVAVDLAGAADPQGRDLRPDAVVATGAGLLGTMAAVLAGRAEPWESTRSADSLAALACRAVGGRGPEAQRLVEATLCLLADHDLATSTRAVRVAASVRANPYSAVSAGLGALDSPLHGMASRPAYRLLRDVVEEPDRAIADVLAAGSGGPPPRASATRSTGSATRAPTSSCTSWARRTRVTRCSRPSIVSRRRWRRGPARSPTSTSRPPHSPTCCTCTATPATSSSRSPAPPAGSPTSSRSTTPSPCATA